MHRTKQLSVGYRPKASYISKDPKKREAQLANLRKGRNRENYLRKDGASSRIKQEDLDKVNIVEFAKDICGVSFEKRPAQEVALRSLYGLPLDTDQRDIYRQLTTNKQEFEPDVEKTEGIWAVGARGGKSFLTSIITCYEATRKKWKQYLDKDETGYAIITATRQQQAQDVVQSACMRLLERSSISYMIAESWQASLQLMNGMVIASFPCNSTAARGLPVFMLIFDEIAHYRTEGVKADETIYNALRPRMAQFPGAKCMLISTPAAKQGLFWDMFDQGFNITGRLTIQAPTRVLNPVIPQSFIDAEYRRNPENASREFGALFAEQVSAFFPMDKLQDCFILAGDVPYDVRFSYYAGIDQSGLAGRDRFAFAVAHREGERIIVDLLRAWDTKDGDAILKDIDAYAKHYRIRNIMTDRYASGWVRSALEKLGLQAEVRPKLADVYTNLKSLVISKKIELPDNQNLRLGLIRTQAYYSKSNNLTIAHERSNSGHGDESDAVATAVYAASKQPDYGFNNSDELAAIDRRDRERNEYTHDVAFGNNDYTREVMLGG